ncbi:hypothetical protein FSPOR_11920 [Fusarium sporotrichioides]|uniref:Uncharacterized protein n=1 Tax=Fusarium sporotrichioides TaxID=5514 RepID=A0A395RDH6_FUSSP|nr:hypothetical protein FSPOR_11920 [Fusarium sporotrichioides]
MAARELLVVILNHTNEELNIEPGSPFLYHGDLMETPDSRPPQQILAGESGLLRCKSSHVYGAIDGSVSYRVVGMEFNNTVAFSWSMPHVGPNKYDCSCSRDDFSIKVLGGRGNQAVAVFVLEPVTDTDAKLDDGVFGAIS